MRVMTGHDDEFSWQHTASYFAYFKTTLIAAANSSKIGRILIWLIINILRRYGVDVRPSYMRL